MTTCCMDGPEKRCNSCGQVIDEVTERYRKERVFLITRYYHMPSCPQKSATPEDLGRVGMACV